MNTSDTAMGASGTDLYVEPGETVLLSPDSRRFGSLYKQMHPSSIDEVSKVVGLSGSAAAAVQSNQACRCVDVPAALVPPADLASEDAAVSRRAKQLAIQAAKQYVRGGGAAALQQWRPLIDRYLQIGKVVINYVVLEDIDVGVGATLAISPTTNALYARKITIHGNGRIWCQGDIFINCASLEGVQRTLPLSATSVLRS